jgi:hypothetical protein
MIPQSKVWNFESSYNMQQAAVMPSKSRKKEMGGGAYLLSFPKIRPSLKGLYKH